MALSKGRSATSFSNREFSCSRGLPASRLVRSQAAILLPPPVAGVVANPQAPANLAHPLPLANEHFSLSEFAYDLFRGVAPSRHVVLSPDVHGSLLSQAMTSALDQLSGGQAAQGMQTRPMSARSCPGGVGCQFPACAQWPTSRSTASRPAGSWSMWDALRIAAADSFHKGRRPSEVDPLP